MKQKIIAALSKVRVWLEAILEFVKSAAAALMGSEPALAVGVARALLTLLVAFGVQITTGRQDDILSLVGAIVALGGFGLTLVTRSKVYAPDTVREIAFHAAATGDPDL